MPKLSQRLGEVRKSMVLAAWKYKIGTVEDIGKIVGLSTTVVYDIIKEDFKKDEV